MVIFKKIAFKGKYQDDQAIPDVINYIFRNDKTPNKVIGGYHVDMDNVSGSMISLSKRFYNYSRIRLHHFVVSFHPEDLYLPSIIPQIAEGICSYIGQRFQIVYALHEDTYYPHIHFVFNAVSYIDGSKYHCSIGEYKQLVGWIGTLLSSYGLYPLISVNYVPSSFDLHE